MKQILVSIIISFSLFANAKGDICAGAYNTEDSSQVLASLTLQVSKEPVKLSEENLRDIEEIKKLSQMNGWVNFWKYWSGNRDVQTKQNSKRKKFLLEREVRVRQVEESISEYEALFRDVEFAYWYLARVTPRLKWLKKQPQTDAVKAEIAELKKTNLPYWKDLGQNYDEYMLVRMYLEEKASQPTTTELGQQQAKAAKEILAAMGAHELAPMFPDLNIPRKRVSLANIGKMFNSNVEAKFAKLKKDQVVEAKLAGRILARRVFISSLRRVVVKLPEKAQPVFRKLLSLVDRNLVKDLYLDDIVKVVELMDQPELQIKTFAESNGRSQFEDEMVLTLAKFLEYTDEWIQIKENAVKVAATTKNPLHQELIASMEKMEAKIKTKEVKRESFFIDPSGIETATTVGAVGLTTYYIWNSQAIADALSSLGALGPIIAAAIGF